MTSPKFVRADGIVTITLSEQEFDLLLLVLGFASGAAATRDKAFFWRCVGLANAVNEGNPGFTPYQIPEEFRGTV